MEQLSLFGDPSEENDHKEAKPKQSEKVPRSSAKFLHVDEDIMMLLKDGKTVVEICKWLIENRGFDASTYSQGTYKIYPPLMQHLKFLEKEKYIRLVEVDRGNGAFEPYKGEISRLADAKYEVI